ncbi:MAG: prepilin-type N-terminal cleavage/methylation domain-containing protein [Deferribacterales bacterium]
MRKGFTLVETAIVLIIIGIIVAGAIKTVTMVDNARAKRILSQVVVLVDAQNQYYERTFRYAGDTNNDGGIDYTTLNASYATFNSAGSGIHTAFNELIQLGIFNDESDATLASGGPAYYARYNNANNVPINIVVIRNVPCLTAFQMEINLDKNQPSDANGIGSGRVRWFSTNAANNIVTATGAWTAGNICGNGTGNTNVMYLFDRLQ